MGFLEFRDTTMRNEADLLGAIDLPVLGLLPFVTTEADVRRAKRKRSMVAAATVVVCIASGAVFYLLQLWKYIV